jgi:glycerate 2-kinase
MRGWIRRRTMDEPKFKDHRAHMRSILDAILGAADPGEAVSRNIALDGGGLRLGSHRQALTPSTGIYIVGLGKASPAMCRAAVRALPRHHLRAGIAAVPRSTTEAAPPPLDYIPAGHPLPDEGGLRAGRAVAKLLQGLKPPDLVIVLISGGGSAMLSLPSPEVTLADLRGINELLIRSGAPIDEINIVRRAISQIKGGGLARMASPAKVVSLILSDVVGDDLASIASGPTVLETSSPEAAMQVLKCHGIWERAPAGVRRALSHEREPKEGVAPPTNILVGTNRHAIEAARRAAGEIGFPVQVLTYEMQGEARHVGQEFGRRMRSLSPPACRIMGGETTVTVQGDGLGGRNQEFALGAATEIDGAHAVAVMAFATDGVDGPTDAAGAIVTGGTLAAARDEGLDTELALSQNNAYPLLDALDCLIRSGPTGTNLNDVCVGLAYP